jgi:hypothetical protein
VTGFPFVHSPEIARQLALAERAELEAQREREEQAEEWLARSTTLAYAHYQENQRVLAAAALEASRAEAAERREREQRLADAEDRRTMLILNGHRPRTIQEVLDAAAGVAG